MNIDTTKPNIEHMQEFLFNPSVTKNFDYVITLSHTDFATSRYYRDAHNINENQKAHISHVDIDSYVPNIAMTYIKTLQLPSILVAGAVIRTGFNLNCFIEKLVKNICETVHNIDSNSSLTYEDVLGKIAIRIYIRPNQALLIKRDIASRIVTAYNCDDATFNDFCIDNMQFINTHNKVCNIFNLIAKSKEPYNPDNTLPSIQHYHTSLFAGNLGAPEDMTLAQFATVYDEHNAPLGYHTLYYYGDDINTVYGSRLYFIKEVDANTLRNYIKRMLDILQTKYQNDTDYNILSRNIQTIIDTQNIEEQYNLFQLILSYMTLSSFFKQHNITNVSYNFDQLEYTYGQQLPKQLLAVLSNTTFVEEDINYILKSTSYIDSLNPSTVKNISEAETFEPFARDVYLDYLDITNKSWKKQNKHEHLWDCYHDWKNRWDEDQDLKDLESSIDYKNIDHYIHQLKINTDVQDIITSLYLLDIMGLLNISTEQVINGQSLATTIQPTPLSLYLLPALISQETWKWFNSLVEYCRQQGMLIKPTLAWKGYKSGEYGALENTLETLANVLDYNRSLDNIVLTWKHPSMRNKKDKVKTIKPNK